MRVPGSEVAAPAGRELAEHVVLDRESIDLVLAWLRSYGETNTREAYRRDLQQFCQWHLDRHPGQPIDLLAVDRQTVDLYARHLAEVRHLKPATVARKLSTLASLYAYAVTEEWLDQSPLAHVRRPRVSTEGTTRALTVEELLAIQNAALAAGDRDYALISLMALTGLRVSEVVSLRIEAVRAEGRHWVVPVVRKGGKRKLIPLPPDVRAALDRYTAGRSHGPLFLDGRGVLSEPLDRHDAARIIRRIARIAGIADPTSITPHSLRAGFVTVLLVAGVPSHRVQEAMGHANLATTERYLRSANLLEEHANYAMADLLSRARRAGAGGAG